MTVQTTLDAESQARAVVEKLRSLKVPCSLVGVSEGPQVVHAELRPEEGVKMYEFSRLRRADDLAYSIGATRVRISAPATGRQVVVVEWDRRDRQLVTLDELPGAGWPMSPSIGLDVENRPVVLHIPDAPHVLVAGQTGAGKSIFLHSVLCSLLRVAGPDRLRLVLVDAKRVELAAYDGLPHVAGEVASDAETAIRQLRGVVANMEKRYELLDALRARSLPEANERLSEPIPYVLVAVDELAELMMTSRKETESILVRLAQKGRAAGVHLLLATQYPKSEIFTGLLRVNVPTRIALSVPDMTASRVVLDQNGAESLLGSGDALLSFAGLPPQRFQGALVTREEIDRTVSRWRLAK